MFRTAEVNAAGPGRARSRALMVAVTAAGLIAAGQGTAHAQPESTPLSPAYTIGHGSLGSIAICIGRLDLEVYPSADGPQPYVVRFESNFVGVTPVCMVDGTFTWHNIDTGASGSDDWALSGWDGPTAGTVRYFDPGPGRVEVTISPSTPHLPGGGEFTAS
ncbi:hypothetical protein [Rhodococcus sp. SJ-3]|uniref:hypothetical protein n=1 Tax=Rhodococcus sp. SJ-3 TaxID=3454628 RepID=UPI003F7A3FC9